MVSSRVKVFRVGSTNARVEVDGQVIRNVRAVRYVFERGKLPVVELQLDASIEVVDPPRRFEVSDCEELPF